MNLKRKDLLDIESLSKEEIELILDTAKPFKKLFTQFSFPGGVPSHVDGGIEYLGECLAQRRGVRAGADRFRGEVTAKGSLATTILMFRLPSCSGLSWIVISVRPFSMNNLALETMSEKVASALTGASVFPVR